MLLILLLSALGLLSLTKLTVSFFYLSYAFFLRPAKDLRAHYGSWAVVTGATDGIGEALAFELACKNLNLILVGRSPDKLERVSTSIKEKYKNVEIKSVVMDLNGDISTAGLEKLREAIEGVEVGVLVNNAGVVNTFPVFFHEGKLDLWKEIAKVNMEALTVITRVVVPGMLERRRGAIVNIGSGSSAVIPSYPLFTVYAATKAYVQQFSRSLYVEYKNKGVDVQCQAPLYVNTKMLQDALGSSRHLFMPSAKTYARAAVRWIGYDPLSVPLFPHYLQWCVLGLLPDFITNYLLLFLHMRLMKPT